MIVQVWQITNTFLFQHLSGPVQFHSIMDVSWGSCASFASQLETTKPGNMRINLIMHHSLNMRVLETNFSCAGFGGWILKCTNLDFEMHPFVSSCFLRPYGLASLCSILHGSWGTFVGVLGSILDWGTLSMAFPNEGALSFGGVVRR